MSDIALTDDWDVDVSGQELHLVEDSEGDPAAITQETGITLLFIKGEWALNVLVGLDWIGRILVKNPSTASLTLYFTRAILSVPGQEEILSILFDFDNSSRLAELSFKSRAQDGGIVEDRIPALDL